MVYVFDRARGRLRWYAHVPDQYLVLDQFEDLPFVLFTAQRHRPLDAPRRRRVLEKTVGVRVIEKRTGKLLYAEEGLPAGLMAHAIRVGPAGRRVEVLGTDRRLVFRALPHPPARK